jgi:hypothetical protein
VLSDVVRNAKNIVVADTFRFTETSWLELQANV